MPERKTALGGPGRWFNYSIAVAAAVAMLLAVIVMYSNHKRADEAAQLATATQTNYEELVSIKTGDIVEIAGWFHLVVYNGKGDRLVVIFPCTASSQVIDYEQWITENVIIRRFGTESWDLAIRTFTRYQLHCQEPEPQ